MAEAGIDFGSHSFSHRSLVELDAKELEKEVKGSKTALEELLGKQIESFSYPYGAFNETVKNMAQQNYKVAFSTKKGISDIQGFALPRIDINKEKILPVLIYFERLDIKNDYQWFYFCLSCPRIGFSGR